MRVLALIPAREGSKGIPFKNGQVLGDKTLLEHAMYCAKNAQQVTAVAVSTDSAAWALAAQKHGCLAIPRPDTLASDTSNVVETVRHALETLPESYDILVLVQPTAPLRTATDLDQIIAQLAADIQCDGMVSVVPFDDLHPARMYRLDDQGNMQSLEPAHEMNRRQDLEPVYYRNGCFYAVRVSAFLKEQTLMPKNKKAYVMNAAWCANIDTPRDLKMAELLYADWVKTVKP
ncbi:MAG: hypothetical protein CFE24_10405 [Flavobacterium sp. BFFFF2]|nr:MAG: hypothetical protein CFE24_10405 [Flavobacterium sp. BFFFF2]